MPFCSTCGAQVVPGVRFCSNCGQAIQQQPQPNNIPKQPVYQHPPPPPPLRKQNGSDSSWFVFEIVLILIIIILPLISFAVYTLNNTSDSYDDDFPSYDKMDNNDDYEPCGEGDFSRKYTWTFEGTEHTFSICIPEESYYLLSKQPRIFEYSEYVQIAEVTLNKLAYSLQEKAEENNYNTVQTINFILSFVQSLEYTSDKVTTGYNEYPRFAIETLVEEGGDCEDTSILFAGFMEVLGYDAILLKLPGDSPNHVAVGLDIGQEIGGVYFNFDNNNYYFCETTSSGYEIGDWPEEFIDTTAIGVRV